jgi:hypothetical protein
MSQYDDGQAYAESTAQGAFPIMGDSWPKPIPNVIYETARPPFDERWRLFFAPDADERVTAYCIAARLEYGSLTRELKALTARQERGLIDVWDAAQARLRLISCHLAETARLAYAHGVTS